MKCLSKFLLAILLLTAASVGWAKGIQTLEQWGKSHYDRFGKAAGRILPASGNYEDYVRSYPDLLAAYNKYIANTAGAGCGMDSRQYRWLNKELSESQTTCTLAYMHHPWRSSGLHGGTPKMQTIGDLLQKSGVDVVLSGHDHIYERFAPQRPDGHPDSQSGLRQFVVGTGGVSRLYPIDAIVAGSEVRNNKVHGVLKLDLLPTSYRWKFISVGDGFTDKGTSSCHEI